MNTPLKSILKNYIASAFGMGINFLNQIAMVPLFISIWGIDKYADWILITSLSTIFTISNSGLNQAVNNEFVIKYHKGDFKICRKLMTNSFILILSIAAVFLSLSIIISYFWGFKEILNVSVFSEFETSVTFTLLFSNVFIKNYGGVYKGILRANSKTHISVTMQNIMNILELAILFSGIILNLNIVVIIAMYMIPSIASVIFIHFYTQNIFPSKFSIKYFDKNIFKSMIKPALAFMAMPLGFALSNQGLVFVINSLLGSVILVTFTTTRTLVNFLKGLMTLIANSVAPEISIAFGKSDKNIIKRIYYSSFVLTFAITVTCIVILIFIGKPIYLYWTKNEVVFNDIFFMGMLFVLLISCLWGLSSIIPLSTNTHNRFTSVFLVLQAIAVLLCFIVLKIFPDLSVIPIILIITEFSLLLYSIKENNKFLNTNFEEMTREIFYQSKLIFHKVTNRL